MKHIKRLFKYISWLEQKKVKAMIHCGRPTSI